MQLTFLEDQPAETVSWPGSRSAALDRLKLFAPRAGRAYAASRNSDFGPKNRGNISCLSPWIRSRLILEEEVLHAVLSYHSLRSAEKFIQEVFWRAYFKGWLEHHPSVWRRYSSDVNRLLEQLNNDPGLQARYGLALSGGTGIDCFDSWVDELVETGYLHNHARMWFASIWIFTLRLPWQMGADFFYRNLLDGDAASNTLSWRWVAGLHTKGKHYVARAANIEKFTNGRFSPTGLATDPKPLAEDFEHPEQVLPEPKALARGRAFGLIVTDEDCSPETLDLPSTPRGVCGLVTAAERSPQAASKPVAQFAQQAVADALRRAEAAFSCGTILADPDAFEQFLVAWAHDLDVDLLAVAFPATGPARDRLHATVHALSKEGITLLPVMRRYDSLCWPHATRGFFKLKRAILDLARSLDLA